MTGDDAAVELDVVDVIDETADVRTIRLDNAAGRFSPHRAGQHVKVCIAGPDGPIWRGFSISSPATRPERIEITVKLKRGGVVSPALHALRRGDAVKIKGPSGRFAFDPEAHSEPIVLLAAGSGITPAMAILETLADVDPGRRATLLYGSRTRADIIFPARLARLHDRLGSLRALLALTRPEPEWPGARGRIGPDLIADQVAQLSASRYFLCGPGAMIDDLSAWLATQGVAPERIHAERFGKPKPPADAGK